MPLNADQVVVLAARRFMYPDDIYRVDLTIAGLDTTTEEANALDAIYAVLGLTTPRTHAGWGTQGISSRMGFVHTKMLEQRAILDQVDAAAALAGVAPAILWSPGAGPLHTRREALVAVETLDGEPYVLASQDDDGVWVGDFLFTLMEPFNELSWVGATVPNTVRVRGWG